MGARTSVVAFVSLVVLLLVTSEGCSSIPDITFDDDGGSGGACSAAGPEICGDGIDNDCNGRTDCADNACDSKLSCVDGVPRDWQVVAFAEGARPPCPAGYGASADVRSVLGPSGPPSCTCNCGGSCADGDVTLAFGGDGSCGGGTQSLDVSGGCAKLTGTADFDVEAATFVKATPPPTPTCNGTAGPSLPPLRDGRTCALDAKATNGCSNGSTCAPRGSDGYQVCVQKAGAAQCPSGFPVLRRAGVSATDTRACSACTCTASPCSVTVKLHDSATCGAPELTVTSGACTKLENEAFRARGYETTVSGGCVPAGPPQGSGNLAFAGESTICCRGSSGGGGGGDDN